MKRPAGRIVVIGASAGGVSALETIVRALPADFRPPILAVLHTLPTAESHLPEILSHAGRLPAVHANGGTRLEPGRILIAPPDHHLEIVDGFIRLNRAPTENRHRPSIDVLFRSAAAVGGPNVIGVLLTGSDDDGTVGLRAIKAAGGTALIQDPADSLFPEMPRSALTYIEPDLLLPLAEIGPALARLAQIPLAETEMGQENKPPAADPAPGTPSGFICPDCGGALWELRDGELLRYRCRIGHVYSPEAMLDAEAEATERALWAAVRALEESADVSRRVAEKTGVLREQFTRRAEERLKHAAIIRELLEKP